MMLLPQNFRKETDSCLLIGLQLEKYTSSSAQHYYSSKFLHRVFSIKQMAKKKNRNSSVNKIRMHFAN